MLIHKMQGFNDSDMFSGSRGECLCGNSGEPWAHQLFMELFLLHSGIVVIILIGIWTTKNTPKSLL